MIALLALLISILPSSSQAQSALPRTILAFYDSHEDAGVRTTRIHRLLEMPLNHLGYTIEYADIHKPLPKLDSDVAGILVWFRAPTELASPQTFLDWLGRALDEKRKLLVFGHMGFGGKFRDSADGMAQINKVLNRIGVNETNHRITLTYESKIVSALPDMMGFERALDILFPPFFEATRSDVKSVSHFRLRHVAGREAVSDLVVTSANGGYVADGYGVYTDARSGAQQWYLNPFRFFEQALGSGDTPKPDVTTLMGRRIFYSQIDGDGWNNVTELEKYKKDKLISAQVITREVLKRFPDLPFTVGIITSELDRRCYGYPQSMPAAVEMLALPNVEPASHSHSHPLYWNYFADGIAAKEKPLLSRYPAKPNYGGLFGTFARQWRDPWKDIDDRHVPPEALVDAQTGENMNEVLKKYFGVPRSYACQPFDLRREVQGSIDFINALSPQDKPVKLFQWSGDTSPFPAAMHAVEMAGVENLNGGDTRYDAEYPSYSWVSPIGLRVADGWQVFSSNSNENTYTHLWTNRFFGFRYLQTTVHNTDSPIRLKPFNVYFHIFSGEKQASLQAVLENLDYAQRQPIIPILAQNYSSIAHGYFTIRLVPIERDRWKILDRGALSTVRIDHATLKQVDFARSTGIIGQRHYQGSLYVTIDAATPQPILALKANPQTGGPPVATMPYLLESNWQVREVRTSPNTLHFTAQGYGKGEMRWAMPSDGHYDVEIRQGEKMLYKNEKLGTSLAILSLRLPVPANAPVQVTLTKL